MKTRSKGVANNDGENVVVGGKPTHRGTHKNNNNSTHKNNNKNNNNSTTTPPPTKNPTKTKSTSQSIHQSNKLKTINKMFRPKRIAVAPTIAAVNANRPWLPQPSLARNLMPHNDIFRPTQLVKIQEEPVPAGAPALPPYGDVYNPPEPLIQHFRDSNYEDPRLAASLAIVAADVVWWRQHPQNLQEIVQNEKHHDRIKKLTSKMMSLLCAVYGRGITTEARLGAMKSIEETPDPNHKARAIHFLDYILLHYGNLSMGLNNKYYQRLDRTDIMKRKPKTFGEEIVKWAKNKTIYSYEHCYGNATDPNDPHPINSAWLGGIPYPVAKHLMLLWPEFVKKLHPANMVLSDDQIDSLYTTRSLYPGVVPAVPPPRDPLPPPPAAPDGA